MLAIVVVSVIIQFNLKDEAMVRLMSRRKQRISIFIVEIEVAWVLARLVVLDFAGEEEMMQLQEQAYFLKNLRFC